MTNRVSIALTSCDDYTHLEVEVTAEQLAHLHNLAKWSRHVERGLWLDVTVLPPQTAVQADFHARYPSARQIDADEILLALRLAGYDVVPVDMFAALGKQAVERGVMGEELVRAWDTYMNRQQASDWQAEADWAAVKKAVEGLRATLDSGAERPS